MNTLHDSISTPFQTQSQQLVINIESEKKEEVTRMFQLVIEQYMPSMLSVLTDRVSTLEQAFIRSTIQEDPQFQCLKNPAMHSLINDAVRAAADTSDEKDLELLGSLLSERSRREGNKRMCLGIKKAIEVAPYVSEEGLCGITIVYLLINALRYYSTLDRTLEYADKIFSRLPLESLPKNDAWVDEMQSYNAILSKPGTFKKINDVLLIMFNSVVLVGIERGSDNYDEAKRLLQSINLDPERQFIDNPLFPNHVILNVLEENLDKAVIVKHQTQRPITEMELEVFKAIFKLYDGEENKLKQAGHMFVKKWNEVPSLKNITDWWSTFSSKLFELMPIGEALAYVNAKRYIPELTMK